MRSKGRKYIFLSIIVVLLIVYLTRFTYFEHSIVSFPDTEIIFSTNDTFFEQTWQPDVKYMNSVKLPYNVADSFSADMHLVIYSDDYSKIIIDEIIKDYNFQKEERGIVSFEFTRTKLIPGERYRICITMENYTEEGNLMLPASTNHGGCSLEERDVAVKLTISVAKFSKIFWVMTVLFPFFSITLFLMLKTKKSFEENIAVSMFIGGILLYVFACMEQLILGMNILYAASIVSLLYSFFIIEKNRIEVKSLISPGFIIYIILFGIIVVTSQGDWLGKRDDLKHWGSVVRDMFYYDSLAKHINTTVILPRYFPLAGILEYIFVYMNGIYNEGIVLIGLQTMILNATIIVTKSLQKKKDVSRIVFCLATVILVPIIFANDISSTLMVDSLQAAIMAWVLIAYYTERLSKYNILRIIGGLITLVLIKDIGLVFAGILALIMFGDIALNQMKKKKLCIKELLFPISCVLILLVSYVSWQIYLSIPAETEYIADTVVTVGEVQSEDSYGITDEKKVEAITVNTGGISIGGILQILKGDGQAYQYEVTQKYIVELFDGETYTFGPINLSFIEVILACFVIISSLGYWNAWNECKTKMNYFGIMMLLGSFVLCLFLLLTYWFTFPSYEAVLLASMDRYLAPYLCAVIVFICCMVTEYVSVDEKKVTYTLLLSTVVLVICTPIDYIVVENKDRDNYTIEEHIYGYDQITEILRSVAQRGEMVQFICSDSDGYSEFIFRNAVCPIVSDHFWWNIVGDREIYDAEWTRYADEGLEYSAQIVSKEEFENRLCEMDYLVLFHGDEGFIKSYANIFEHSEEILDGSVYKVLKQDEGVKLHRIGTTGIKGWR